MSESKPQISTPIRERAADCFTLMHSEDISEEERIQCLQWLAEAPAHQQAYEEMAQVWQGIGQLAHSSEGQKLVHASERPSLWQFIQRCLQPQWLAGAAALVCLGLALLLLLPPLTAQQQSTQEAPLTQDYASPRGHISHIQLADGSHIELGADSALRVSLGTSERQVELLRGEAYFDVAHDKQRPFFVSAGPLRVRVVGTRFDVHRGIDSQTVSVLEGQVKVSGGANASTGLPDQVALRHGDKLIRHSNGAFSSVLNVAPQELAAWRQGRLIYRSESLQNVIADANRYFDGKIELQAESLAEEKVTLTLRSDQIALLPQLLKETLGVSVHEAEKRHFIIAAE